jgi:hypothetical protein
MVEIFQFEIIQTASGFSERNHNNPHSALGRQVLHDASRMEGPEVKGHRESLKEKDDATKYSVH